MDGLSIIRGAVVTVAEIKERMGRKNKGNHLAKTRQESAASAAHTGRSNQRAVKKEFLKAKHINATVMILRGFLSGEEITSLQLLGPRGRQVCTSRVCAALEISLGARYSTLPRSHI